MKLRDLFICLDCDEVFELETVYFLDQKVQMDHCPSCGNKSIKRMCLWLQTMKAESCIAGLIAGQEATGSSLRIERNLKVAATPNQSEEKEGGVNETTALKGTET